MYKLIEFDKQDKYINEFINLSHKLYSEHEIMQNDLELEQLLRDKHVLSKYFTLKKFLIYKNNDVVSRVVLTFYENDNTAYFGFFETENDVEAVKFMFENLDKIVRDYGKERILGPVNASFWICYRLKINNFNEQPYIGEPYNKNYYYDLLKKVGFADYETYYTNFYNKPNLKYENDKASERYKLFTLKGYKLKTLEDFEDIEDACDIIYDMIIQLYKNFPIFKWISKEDYIEYSKNSYKILDYKMQKIYYYNGEPVAFCIVLPNYNNLLVQNLEENKLEILKRKDRSEEYSISYMGVKKRHAGLGLAMANEIISDLKEKNAQPIASLIKKSKVTSKYINEEIIKQNEYVLLYKEI